MYCRPVVAWNDDKMTSGRLLLTTSGYIRDQLAEVGQVPWNSVKQATKHLGAELELDPPAAC